MKKAIFLDRDGTIIKFKFPLTQESEVQLLDNAGKAIKIMNDKGYLVIIVSNQPAIAMNYCSKEKVDSIHRYLLGKLAEYGARVDAVYYCPHFDGEFQGGNKALLHPCSCRKPSPGLIFKASEDFDIDLKKSYMVGDTYKDIGAGNAAGCKSIFVKSGAGTAINGVEIYDDIYEFAKKL